MSPYPIQSPQQLKNFLQSYLPEVFRVAKKFKINLLDKKFQCDHLGLQVLSKQEFDEVDDVLTQYSDLIYRSIVHKRRNRVYRFHQAIKTKGIIVPRIETFEPKPNVDLDELRPGIEHIAFVVKGYDKFLAECQKNNLPIDKIKTIHGSKFFKTKLIDNIEIEFRNDKLGE